MKQVHVRPSDGLIVRIPGRPHEILPLEGMSVPISASDPYWQRRINDGDVIVVDVNVSKAPGKGAAKKES